MIENFRDELPQLMTRMKAMVEGALIGFRPYGALRGGLAGKDAAPSVGRFFERDTADCHAQLILDFPLKLSAAIPIGKSKPAVNLGFRRVLRRKEGKEILLASHEPRMLVAKRGCPGQQV